MYPKLICLFGPDGTGKSTHVEILYSLLRGKGEKVKKVWIRGPHTFSFILSWVLVRSGRYRIYRNPYGRVKKVVRISGGTSKKLWAFSEFISVLPLTLLKVALPLRLGYTVVADRYVLDSIVSIAYNVEEMAFTSGRLARILLRQIPEGSILVFLDSDYRTLCERRGRLVEPPQFISFQRTCYRTLRQKVRTHYIDTSNKTIGETSSHIRDIISKTMKEVN